jgi:WD40 repeat protein
MNTPAEFRVGQRLRPPREGPPAIPDYELLRPIGRGSYGEVWLGRSVTGAYRAVKIVYRDTFDHERPYEREFRGIQKFEPISRTHTSQVAVMHVGFGPDRQFFYYVMELADDAENDLEIVPDRYRPRTLKHELAAGEPLGFDSSVELGVRLATALDHLHRNGLVHRDIKPSNIIFVNGVPKLADIGLVAAQDATISFVGTVGYLPPEGQGTPQADVYSLGKVLYEASTGKDRGDFPDPPTAIGSDADVAAHAELNEIILKACANNPRDRYASAAEMRADLLLLQSGRSVKRVRMLERRLGQIRKFGTVAALIAVIVTAGYVHQQRQARTTRALSAQSHERLVRMHVANALHLIENDDILTSAVWLAEALKLARTPDEADIHRRRIGAVLRATPTVARMGAHEWPINHAQISADGQWLLTTSDDRTAVVWDLESGRLKARLRHAESVTHASFSPDGLRVVTASNDGTACVWDAMSGERLAPPLRHDAAVVYAWFDAEGRRVVTASRDGTARVWDAQTGLPLIDPLRHQDEVGFACFSPDGRTVISTSLDGTAKLWDAATGHLAVPPLVHGHEVTYAAFSPDSRIVVTGCRDGAARVWDVATGETTTPPLHHEAKVRYVCFSPEGNRILVAAGEHRIHGLARVWELATGAPLTPPLRHNGHVSHAAFSPDGRRVATASSDHSVRVWDATSGQPIGARLKHSMPCWFVEFSPDGRHLLTAGRDRLWRLWDLATERNTTEWHPVVPFQRSFTEAAWRSLTNCLANGRYFRDGTKASRIWISPDGRSVAAMTSGTEAWVLDVETGQTIAGPLRHELDIKTVEFSPDGRWIATGSMDRTARVWETATGRPVTPPLPHRYHVYRTVFSPDASLLATAAKEIEVIGGEARIWIVATGEPATPALEHEVAVSDVAFSPDGRWLATACGDRNAIQASAQIWDVATGNPVGQPMIHERDLCVVTFSPDGRLIATAANDGTARLWDPVTGEPIGRPLKHPRGMAAALFSRDGRLLASASSDGTVRIWERATGDLVYPSLDPIPLLCSMASSPENNWLVVARYDGWSRLLAVGADSRAVGLLQDIARVAAGVRVDDGGGLEPVSTEAVLESFDRVVANGEIRSILDPEISRRWHQSQAQAAAFETNRVAARFHAARLIDLERGDLDSLSQGAQVVRGGGEHD